MVSYTSDFEGNNIITSGKRALELSDQTNTVRSDYLGYGSFSGADIKVVVHYPYSQRVQKALARQKAEIEARYVAIEPAQTPQESINNQNEINILQEEIESLDKELKSVQELPTSKVLGEIQTISWSIFREKSPVRTLGSVYPRAYVRGPRCIPAGEQVFIRNKGLVNIEDVKSGDYVQSSGISFNKVVNTFKQGIKDCYSLKLQNGYSLTASHDHPISTTSGWINMEDLKPGDNVYICGNTPSHDNDYKISNELLKMIAYLIGDGTTRIYNYDGKITTRIGLSIADNEISTIGLDTKNCLSKLNIEFNDNRKNNNKCITRVINVCKPGKGLTDWRTREYNLLHKALLKYNQYNKYSFEKQIPNEFLCGLSTKQIVLFLKHLFATDGGYSISKDKKYIEFKYSSTSEILINQIRLLLNKLGINAIKSKENKVRKTGGRPDIISRHDCFSLIVSDSLELLRFVRRVGVFGKDKKILPCLKLLTNRIKYNSFDIYLKDFVDKVKEAATRKNLSTNQICNKFGLYDKKRKITPRRAYQIANHLHDVEFFSFLHELTENLINKRHNLIERKVVSIEPTISLPVYDLEVEDRHCFSCNGIIVHNTIGGSMIFTVFHQHVLHELLALNLGMFSTGTSDHDNFRYSTNLADQVPPIDISLVFANEYGAISHMGIWGLEFVQEGGTFSIEDIFSESQVQYVARDLDPMRLVNSRKIDSQGVTTQWTKTASNLLYEQQGLTEHLRRRDPFI